MIRSLLAGLGVLAGLVGCRVARVPMPVVAFGEAASPSKDLIVFLPGRYDRPEDFESRGFVKMLRDAGVRADLTAADAHLGYFKNRSVVTRLMEDVVKPARERGVERIWLVGISMGGYGSLAALSEHPDEFAGALIIAPWLGESRVVDEIREAGGLTGWTPPPDPTDPGEVIWSRIRTLHESGVLDRVGLAYGVDDRFASAAAELATLLGGDRVLARDGGHDWETWERLFAEIVSEGMFFLGDLAATGKGT